MFNYPKNDIKNSHIPPCCKQSVFLIMFLVTDFLVTNRNVFEEHKNTPEVEI